MIWGIAIFWGEIGNDVQLKLFNFRYVFKLQSYENAKTIIKLFNIELFQIWRKNLNRNAHGSTPKNSIRYSVFRHIQLFCFLKLSITSIHPRNSFERRKSNRNWFKTIFLMPFVFFFSQTKSSNQYFRSSNEIKCNFLRFNPKNISSLVMTVYFSRMIKVLYRFCAI